MNRVIQIIKGRWRIIATIALLAFISVYLIFVGDRGSNTEVTISEDDSETAVKSKQFPALEDLWPVPPSDDAPINAILKHRTDVRDATYYMMEVNYHADIGGVTAPVISGNHDASNQVIVTVLVKVRGVDAATVVDLDWTRHPNQIERIRERHAQGADYVWDILGKADVIRLTNIEPCPVLPICEGGIHADMFVDIDGESIKFADLLIEEGHALPIKDLSDRYDWGGRIPKRILH